MRIHYGETMTAITNYLPLVRAAEENGYDGFTIPDSLIYPKASDTLYSYTEDGGRTFLENKPFLETFTLAMAVGAVTETLQITTTVLKLPVRPPLYSAKLAASVAAFTNNRFNLGVGLSVWPEDYAAMGLPYERRGARFDECIEIVRGFTAGGYFEFHGEFYDIPAAKLNPVPSEPIPILIGGHSDAAFKRAARNDGHVFTGADFELLEAGIGKIRRFQAELGVQDKPPRIFNTVFEKVDHDLIKRSADLGVTDIAVVFRNAYAVEEDSEPLEHKLDTMKRFADEVIAKL